MNSIRYLEERLSSWLGVLPLLAGGLLILLGATVLAGWLTGAATWVQVRSDLAPMQGNTAMGFMLCGAALLILYRGGRRLPELLALVVAGFALLTLSEYLFGFDLGINQILFDHAIVTRTSHPGRMAPNTALAFAMAGMALIALLRLGFVGALLGCLVFTLGAVAFLGYLADVPLVFGWGGFTQMAIHTAMGFAVLGIGLVAFAFEKQRRETRSSVHWVPLLAGATVAVTALLFWHALRNQELTQIRWATDANARAVDAEIVARIEPIVTALTHLAEEGAAAGWQSPADWRSDAWLTVGAFPGVEMVEWIDRDFVARIVASPTNPRPLAADANGLLRQALEFTRATEAPLVVAPFPFADGGTAFRVVASLILRDRPDAYLSAVFSAHEVFGALPENIAPGYELLILCWNSEVFRHGDLRESAATIWTRSRVLHVPGALPWRLVIAPGPEQFDAQRTALPEVVLGAGLLIAVLLGLTLRFGEAAMLRARQFEMGVRERTADLEAEIVERQRAEAALRQKTEQLAEADRRKDAFMAMLGHELRNPLGAINNAAEVLGTHPKEPAAEQMRAIIRRQVDHLGRLVDDLLDLSRIERGKLAVRRTRFELLKLVNDVLGPERMALEAAGLTLEAELPKQPLWVDGDPTRIAQIIGNLLSNARKFSDVGGVVQVKVAAEAGQARISVRDSGCGIAPEDLQYVFTPFRRGRAALDRETGGLGLGLAIARELVRVHGGIIEAHSVGRDQGAELVFTLPLQEAPTKPIESLQPDEVETRGRRILIVDDQRDSALALAELLGAYGHTVELAYDGPGAVAAAPGFAPELVICDIGLPGMDGYQVAQALRQEPQTRRARLVALTGFGDAEAIQRSREVGFDQHLIKPVSPARLKAIIADLPARETGSV